MRRGITKAVSAMVAAALACSMVPASALAADEAASGSSTLGVKLTYLQLSVDAPASIVFEPSEDVGYDVLAPDNWGDLKAQVPFTNKSESAVYLAGAKVLQDGDVNVGNVFNGPLTASNGVVGSDANPFLTLRAADSGPAAVCSTVDPKADSTDMDFGSTWISTFTIDERKSADTGTEASFALSLDKTAAALKPLTSIKGGTDNSLTDFCSMTWTFAMVPDFYLQIAPDASHANLSANKGKVYSLEDVTKMAEDISARGTNSTYYNMFNAMVTDVTTSSATDASNVAAGQYECKVNWDALYDVRVIGINHDDLADGTGKAGLTFQFKNLLNTIYEDMKNVEHTDGWGASPLQTNMNSGDIWKTIPSSLQQAFKTVRKPYSSTNSGNGTEANSNDKVFVTSYVEMTNNIRTDWYDTYNGKYLKAKEGDQYAYWTSKAAGNNINSCLRKGMQQTPEVANDWLLRSLVPNDSPTSYAKVRGSDGVVTAPGVQGVCGICPCFCL